MKNVWERLISCVLVLSLLVTGCGGAGKKDPNAAFHLYRFENGQSIFVRSFGWDETDAIMAISGLTGVPSVENTEITNPNYMIEGINKDNLGQFIAPLILYLWIDETGQQLRYYSPDASVGTALEPVPLGPCDVAPDAARYFAEKVLP